MRSVMSVIDVVAIMPYYIGKRLAFNVIMYVFRATYS